MKSSKIRLQGNRKFSNKKKKLEKTQFDVTHVMGDLDSYTPDSEPEVQCENETESVESEFKEAETVDEISKFIREQESNQEEAHNNDEIYETTMQVDAVINLPPVDDNKKMKRRAVLEAKVENFEKKLDIFANDLKEVKNLLKIRAKTPKNTGQIAAYCKEAGVFPLLPKFQLKKVASVEKMELDIHAHAEYKEQLALKMSLFGGRTVKGIVINIFKKMFTAKLKAKFCWTGSSKGKGKQAFQKFDGIISAIQIAASAHFDCTITDIEEECKLRFKQAQKDYDREKIKKQKQYQRLERERLALEMNQLSEDE